MKLSKIIIEKMRGFSKEVRKLINFDKIPFRSNQKQQSNRRS